MVGEQLLAQFEQIIFLGGGNPLSPGLHDRRPHDLENVGLAGKVGAERVPFPFVHAALEQRAERASEVDAHLLERVGEQLLGRATGLEA